MDQISSTQAQLEKQLSQAVETGMAVVTTYGLQVLGAIAILVIGWIAAGFVQRGILRGFARFRGVDQTIVTFAASTAKYAVLTFTLVAVLSSVGVQTTSFVAVIGALGLAIGLALQGTLNHVASGMLLVLLRPFRVGDSVETAGVAGVVKAITLFTTEIASADNIKIVVPNGAILGGVIKNVTGHATRRIDVEVPVAHTSNIGKALELAKAVVAKDLRILPDPPPAIGIARLGDAAAMLSVQVWVKTEDLLGVKGELILGLKHSFDREGIAFPAPPPPTRPT
ncbi:MAG: mechanosensitive ion channel [Rhodospirillaceae bacterium]|nr:mechanosensitive ion channel [Rhodospirillaceae bacterium]